MSRAAEIVEKAKAGQLPTDLDVWTELEDEAPEVLADALESLADVRDVSGGNYVLLLAADEEWVRWEDDFEQSCTTVAEALDSLAAAYGSSDLREAVSNLALLPYQVEDNPELFSLPEEFDPELVVFALAAEAPNPWFSAVLMEAQAPEEP